MMKLCTMCGIKHQEELFLTLHLLVVKGCGHLAPSECAEPVTKGTVNFLKSMPPVTGMESTVAGR